LNLEIYNLQFVQRKLQIAQRNLYCDFCDLHFTICELAICATYFLICAVELANLQIFELINLQLTVCQIQIANRAAQLAQQFLQFALLRNL